jgi:hypothetical protein
LESIAAEIQLEMEHMERAAEQALDGDRQGDRSLDQAA